MKKIWCILLMGLLACISQAAVVEYELDCAGMYYESNPTWSTNFDLGEQFSSITSVSIIWSGGFGPALIYNSITTDDEWADVAIAAYISNDDSAIEWGGEMDGPEEELFSCQSYFSGTQWSYLLDGTGYISIEFEESSLVGIGDYFVSHGAVRLNNAVFVVEGTLVPEPLSIALLSIGSIIALRKRVS